MSTDKILEVEHLRPNAYSILLLEYSMTCRRVPPGLCVMYPPQDYANEHGRSLTSAQLLEHISNSYLRMLFMLCDDFSTPGERTQVESYVPLVALKRWLPQVDVNQIERMPTPPNMDMHKYLFLMNDCQGRYSKDDEYCYFLNVESMNKFKTYMGLSV